MSAFLVFIREKTLDQSELKAYWAKIRATTEGQSWKSHGEPTCIQVGGMRAAMNAMSLMDTCNVSALIPARKSSNGVQSPRFDL